MKSYIVVHADYIERIEEIEERLDKLENNLILHAEEKRDKALSEEEKAKWQRQVDEMKAKKKRDQEERPFIIWPRTVRVTHPRLFLKLKATRSRRA